MAGALTWVGSSDPAVQAMVQAAKEAFVLGWREALWVGAMVLVVLAAYVLMAGPRTKVAES